MPLTDDAYALLQEHVKTVFDEQWQDFRSVRRDAWMPVVEREMPLDVQKILGSTWHFPIQGPGSQAAGDEHCAILTMNQSKTSLIPLETGQDAKRDIGQVETWLTSIMNKLNPGRWWDRWNSEGQTYHGLAVSRLCYEAPLEPDDDDLEPYVGRYRLEDEDKPKPEGAANDYASDLGYKERARQEYYAEAAAKTFRLRGVAYDTFACGPDLNDPGIYIEKCTISYAEFERLKTRDGKKLGLDALGKVYILGAGENTESGDSKANQSKKFEYIRENIRDPETGKWVCREFVSMQGTANESYQQNAELVQEYDIPFPHPEYILCPSGNEMLTEQDPHKRYQPILKRLMVYEYELNYWLTIQAEMALMEVSGRGQAIELRPGPNQGMISELFKGDGYQVMEGAGARGTQVWLDRADADPSRIPVYPGEIVPLPSMNSENMRLRIDYLQGVAIPGALPNRFLTGQVASSETAGAPATSLAMQTQAAALPYDLHLAKQDEGKEGLASRVVNFIRTTDEGVAPDLQKRYPMVASGEEGPGVKPGEMIEVTAWKLRRKFDIHCFTKRETLQEEQQLQAMAQVDLDRGQTTVEDFFEKKGHTDPLAYIESLNKERKKAKVRMLFEAEEEQELRGLRMVMSGIVPQIQVDPMTGMPLAPGMVPPGAPPNGAQPPMAEVPGAPGNVAVPAMQGPSGGSEGFV